LNAENLKQINELEVVQEVSDESFEQSAQPIDRSVNSYTLEVDNVLNSPRTRQQAIAREFDFLDYDLDGFGAFSRNDDFVLQSEHLP
jgi:hypothetical protein